MSVVNTNVKALFAQEASRVNELKMNKSMERLSTGLRINSAKDDAAGLAITNNMTSQIRGMAVAVRNANDGISMSQTAEGAYGEVENMLQRIRELAVQAANGAMSDDDRASLQLEVDELITQIDKVADTTNHNNIKLLDGSARNVVLQVGTKEGDTMAIGFDSAKASQIGQGSQVMLQSAGGIRTGDAVFGAFASGDLLINGVDVGASLAADDTASSSENASSAIAKAAAINRVSDQTGVYAKALQTTVHGYQGTMSSSVANGTITINGVSTITIYSTDDEAYTRGVVTEAINRISGQTGVKAIDTGDDNLGVQLVAEDGRNIVHAFTGTLDNQITGLGAAATTVGSFGLYTQDGRDITISHSLTGSRVDSGLAAGTYKSDEALYTSKARGNPGTGSAPTSGDAGVLNGNTLVLNGVSIRAAAGADDQFSHEAASGGSSYKSASAIAIAAAINERTSDHGVTATAAPNVLRGTAFTAAATTKIHLNGVDISTSLTTYTIDDMVNLLNTYSDRTGVTASNFNGAMQLVAEDGRNISIATDSDAAALGLTDVSVGTGADGTDDHQQAITHYSRVTLSSDVEFDVSAGAEGYANFTALGFREGTFGGTDDGKKVSEISLTSISGAAEALTVVDAAITQVSAAQAKAGAFQNRLDYVVSNLSEASQNMSASRSRILDADYATETTELARAQIIQQAATAMLAQANQSAQGVLALLQ
jgi:flagellin